MKTVFVFVCIVAVVLAALPPSEVQFLKQVHDSCQSNPSTRADENKLRNLVNFTDDPQVGDHMNCMATNTGFQTHNGSLNIPNMKIKLGLVLDPSKVDDIIQKCAKPSTTPGKTAALMWVCLFQNGSKYYHKL